MFGSAGRSIGRSCCAQSVSHEGRVTFPARRIRSLRTSTNCILSVLLLVVSGRPDATAAEVEKLQVVIAVTDGRGNTTGGADVNLIPSTSAGAALARRKLTGANGEAVFDLVPVGLYHMEIRADGYAPVVVMRFAVNRQSVKDGAVRGRFKLTVRSAPPAPRKAG